MTTSDAFCEEDFFVASSIERSDDALAWLERMPREGKSAELLLFESYASLA